jgi:flagellar motor switch/type III secretory pathway protein FliN
MPGPTIAQTGVSSPRFFVCNILGAISPKLKNVSIDIAVVLGTSSMPIHQVLRLRRGAIIQLDASEEDEVR